MQQPVPPNLARVPRRRPTTSTASGAVWLAFSVACTGCGGDEPARTAGEQNKAFTGVSLSLHCPDAPFAAAIAPAAQSWATRTGATVKVVVGAMEPGDAADIGILRAADLGAWAERDIAPVPNTLRASEHPFQWTGILPYYREHFIEWGGQARAVPLTGDGYVVVYKTDRMADPPFVAAFRKKYGKEPTAPTSWEEFAALAATFTEVSQKPSLPPMTPEETADLFFRVALGYDRRAIGDGAAAAKGTDLSLSSFQHNLETGEPRLESAGFRAAADWFAGLAASKCVPPAPTGAADPAAAAVALDKGGAAIAVLSLEQLAKLPRDATGTVPANFAVAPLPGTAPPAAGEKKDAGGAKNYVPYLSGGRLGVVRTRCANAAAAFDLLAEIGNPTRSLETLATPGLGAGPFRTTHLEREHLRAWYGYGFDPDRTRALQDAMRQYLRADVRNPGYGLREPDQRELNAAVASGVAKIAAGTTSAADGLKQVTEAWRQIDAKSPDGKPAAETRLRWRKLSAGVK